MESYIIYEDNGEMIDVISFQDDQEHQSYLKAHPDHVLILSDDLDGTFLLNDEEEFIIGEETS